jgi:hypothetical protein
MISDRLLFALSKNAWNASMPCLPPIGHILQLCSFQDAVICSSRCLFLSKCSPSWTMFSLLENWTIRQMSVRLCSSSKISMASWHVRPLSSLTYIISKVAADVVMFDSSPRFLKTLLDSVHIFLSKTLIADDMLSIFAFHRKRHGTVR